MDKTPQRARSRSSTAASEFPRFDPVRRPGEGAGDLSQSTVGMGRRSTAFKLAAGVAATFAFVCAQADALQFQPRTKAGVTCPIAAVGDATSYGVSIPACDI